MEDVKQPYVQSDDKEEYVLEEIVCRQNLTTDMNYRHKYLWMLVLVHTLMQLSWLIGIYTAFFHAKLATFLWAVFVSLCATQGVALGAHRGFTHNQFKMTQTLKFFLILWQTMSGQNSVFTWVRDHRLHHKYSDTDADPHNSTRGFFFAHMGWLLVKKHPLLIMKQRQLDMSDIKADKMIMFQYRYFLQLYFVTVLVPVLIPIFFWDETLWSSFFVAYCLQYVTSLHITWNTNSFAHLWGSKTYDNRIKATQSQIAMISSLGESRHNFHHTFPWDSRMAEEGQLLSFSSFLLRIFDYLGLAYDLRVASPNVVSRHMKKHGDETGKKTYLEKLKERKDLFKKLMAIMD